MKTLARLAALVLVLALVLSLGGCRSNGSAPPPDDWTPLFDGRTLDGWRAAENPATFRVENGEIVVHGPRAHLFYDGPVMRHAFGDFELKLDVMTRPGANSGIYIRTAYQDTDWPSQGYEVQVNNSHTDWRRTGSLYGVQDVREGVGDDRWFTVHAIVRGRHVRVLVDGRQTVDYTEPAGSATRLTGGTIALQGHDPESEVRYRNIRIRSLLVPIAPTALAAQGDTARASRPVVVCDACAEWNAPQRPFRIHGNTHYVGTRGLSAILVASPEGHVLIDGGLAESAPHILANIRALGFRVEDVRLVLNSHAHYDHAGGIAALQRATGAAVAAHPWSAAVLRRGTSIAGDPQLGLDIPYPPVATVRELANGDTVRVGPLALVAHFTGGHTPGGTSWTWRSCEGDVCRDMVYVDSQTPVSADEFLFTRNTTYPNAVADFERGFALLDRLPCDVLLTPHPGFSELFERLAAREAGKADAFRDAGACRRLAAQSRRRLAQRLATERAGR